MSRPKTLLVGKKEGKDIRLLLSAIFALDPHVCALFPWLAKGKKIGISTGKLFKRCVHGTAVSRGCPRRRGKAKFSI